MIVLLDHDKRKVMNKLISAQTCRVYSFVHEMIQRYSEGSLNLEIVMDTINE